MAIVTLRKYSRWQRFIRTYRGYRDIRMGRIESARWAWMMAWV